MAKQNQLMRSRRSLLSVANLKSKTQQGIALLESMIAIVIFSMGILALAGLQSVLVKNTSEAKYRVEAMFIAQQRLGELWVGEKATLQEYKEVETDISELFPLPNGTRSLDVSAECVVEVKVTWQSPGETQEHNYSTNARIQGVGYGDCPD